MGPSTESLPVLIIWKRPLGLTRAGGRAQKSDSMPAKTAAAAIIFRVALIVVARISDAQRKSAILLSPAACGIAMSGRYRGSIDARANHTRA